MSEPQVHIRPTTTDDIDAVHRVCLAAFGDEEATTVAELAVELLREVSAPRCLCLVAEADGEVVGYVAFSPVWFVDGTVAGYILAPLGVMPLRQRAGVGLALVTRGFELCREAGGAMAFVYGDPAYYGRFGFEQQLATRYPAPHPLSMPYGWQAMRLKLADHEPSQGKLVCVGPLDSPELW